MKNNKNFFFNLCLNVNSTNEPFKVMMSEERKEIIVFSFIMNFRIILAQE